MKKNLIIDTIGCIAADYSRYDCRISSSNYNHDDKFMSILTFNGSEEVVIKYSSVDSLYSEFKKANRGSERFTHIVIFGKKGEIDRIQFPNEVVEIHSTDDYIDSKIKCANEIRYYFNCRNPDNNKIFFIGDPHFNHKNIIRYCNRPWNSGIDSDGNMIITDDDVSRMNEDLITNWNSIIEDDDVVYCMGDFALGDRNKIPDIVSRLKGKKRLVMGNHDWFHIKDTSTYNGVVDFFYKAGFERVYDVPIMIQSFIMLSHEPVHWIRKVDTYMNIFAHVHNQEIYKDYTTNTFCCSAERINYTPISLETILERCKSYVSTNQ